MDKGVVVDIGNDIEGFVPVSQLSPTRQARSTVPADVVYETMNLDMRVLEVDPIHRRIVLAVDEHPGGAAAASGDAAEDPHRGRRSRRDPGRHRDRGGRRIDVRWERGKWGESRFSYADARAGTASWLNRL